MALKNRKEMPDIGEIVIGTIKEVHDFGAYMTIDEYNDLRAFLPWSEVATKAVKNINEVIKENQKLAVKVIRIYRNKGQVDVSLKRVNDNERKRKMMYWKRTLKAVNLILMAAKQINKSEDEAYKEVVWHLEDYFGDAMTGLEAINLEGKDALRKAKIPTEWHDVLMDYAKKYVEVKHVQISGYFNLKSLESDGIDKIKKILLDIKEEVKKYEGVDIKIYTIGSPKYRIDLIGPDYKTLENVIEKLSSKGEKLAKELKVEYSFERIKA